MATGFIGTSIAAAAASISSGNLGATLSYTCPGSGVRYAVVTITARIYSGGLTVANVTRAGQLYWYPPSVTDLYKESIYTTILGPNQTWSDSTYAYNSGSSTITAHLSASVLEVA